MAQASEVHARLFWWFHHLPDMYAMPEPCKL